MQISDAQRGHDLQRRAWETRHQLDHPIGRSAMIVFTVSGAEIDRRRWLPAFSTAQARQKFRKADTAALLDHQADREECRAPAAVKFELALRPVG